MKMQTRFAACLRIAALALPMSSAITAAAAPGKTAPSDRPPVTAICSPDDARASAFRPGDRITVTMYERIEPSDNDRLPSKAQFPDYRLRPEVSGDFNIGEDGRISIPILGPFKAAGKSAAELHDALAHAFETVLGHVGLITIAIAERQPVYIDGVVKNPGAYKYTPGLTVFHALSLAGGYEDIKLESHQVLLTTAQEAINGAQAKDNLMRLLARAAVLRAELNHTVAPVPPALLDLTDEVHAKALMDSQIKEGETVATTNSVLEQQQAQLIESSKHAIAVRTDEMKMVDDAIAARNKRLKTMSSMMSKGLVSDPLLENAKAEYLDTLARKQELTASSEQSRAQLTDAQSSLAKLKLDARYALQHELSDLQLQIAQQSDLYRTHLAVERIMNADPNLAPGGAPMEFDLIRRVGDHVATYRVQGSCLLQPGDLVRIRQVSPQPPPNGAGTLEPSSADRN